MPGDCIRAPRSLCTLRRIGLALQASSCCSGGQWELRCWPGWEEMFKADLKRLLEILSDCSGVIEEGRDNCCEESGLGYDLFLVTCIKLGCWSISVTQLAVLFSFIIYHSHDLFLQKWQCPVFLSSLCSGSGNRKLRSQIPICQKSAFLPVGIS